MHVKHIGRTVYTLFGSYLALTLGSLFEIILEPRKLVVLLGQKMKIPLEERFFEVYYVWLTFLHIKFVATKWHWNDTEPKWQYFCEMFLLVVITLHLIVHYMFKHTLVQYSYKNPNRYIGNQKLTWSALVEGYEQPYRPHCYSVHKGKHIFLSAMGGLFLKLIYHGAGTVVHLLLRKFSIKNKYSNEPVWRKFSPISQWALHRRSRARAGLR